MKLAIVGAGPSAFYAASRILANDVRPHIVHMYDRLWAPYGLVRYGIAPDHPEVRNCIKKFELVASDPRFQFFGNVTVSSQIKRPQETADGLSLPLSEIFKHYTHLLFATGCTVPKQHPSLGTSKYCIPGISFVHWYTRHPSAPPSISLKGVSHVSIIGNGNVSLDIARMLLTSYEKLTRMDIPSHVLDTLRTSDVKHVSIIARRGPLEAAFTNAELREIMRLEDAALVPIAPKVLELPKEVEASLTRQKKRTIQLLRQGSEKVVGQTEKTWSLEFYRNPTQFVPPQSLSNKGTLTLSHTSLDPVTREALSIPETSALETSLVIPSLGSRASDDIPFYDNSIGHLRNFGGRIMSSTGNYVKNVYVSGWAAHGATGTVSTTMMDSYDIAQSILADINVQPPIVTKVSEETALASEEAATTAKTSAFGIDVVMNELPDTADPPPAVLSGVKNGVVVTWKDWLKLDKEELDQGRAFGKERERLDWNGVKQLLQ